MLTWMALSLCQDRHRLFSMIGTRTLWSMLVPVLPKELSVLPHPATTPTLPTRSTSWAGRQMGKILSWYSTGRSNLSTATSNRSGWVNMYRKSGCKVIWSTLKDSEPRGSLTCKEKLSTDFHFVQKTFVWNQQKHHFPIVLDVPAEIDYIAGDPESWLNGRIYPF